MDYMITRIKNKKAQEEMVGFAVIIVIVSVILVVLLSLAIKKPQKEEIDSYEVEGFIQSFLQYTTDCRDSRTIGALSIKDLIKECDSRSKCLDGREACDVLEEDLGGILEGSWIVQEGSPIRGYTLNITTSGEVVFLAEKGEKTQNYKGSTQPLFGGVKVMFRAYS